MILKLLLVIAVIGIVYFMFIKKSPLSRSKKRETKESSEDMIACEACGTYTSVGDAIIKGGHYYCSSECLGK
ncbi:MAG: PP0621 family protein [Campylobacterota bacterium]|nr:PP0621 family protein [Campylobacterota bacterium]